MPYWHPSFRDEVESQTVEAGILIWAFSGPSFAVRTPECMLYLDPYFGGDPPDHVSDTYRTTAVPLDPAQIRQADAIIVTHDHYDHTHEDTLLAMAQGTAAQLYGPPSAVKKMREFGLPAERIHEVKAGEQFQVNDVNVTVWAGHDEDEPEAVMYLLSASGVRLLFAGDSGAGSSFDAIGARGDLDIAMLAFGRVWYMNESEMLAAALRLRPKLLLPYHWELWRGHTGDPLELGRLVERRQLPFEVRLLLVGDYLHYRPGGQFTKGS